jgi:hypothetical protein
MKTNFQLENDSIPTPSDLFKTVNDGNMTAMQAAAYCRKMMAAYEKTYKAIQGQLLSEIQNYGKEKALVYGCQFSTSSTGNRYDYSADGQYSDIEKQLSDRKKLLEIAAKSGKIIIDPDTGEEIAPVPVKSYSSTTILVSIKENIYEAGIVVPVYSDGKDLPFD